MRNCNPHENDAHDWIVRAVKQVQVSSADEHGEGAEEGMPDGAVLLQRMCMQGRCGPLLPCRRISGGLLAVTSYCWSRRNRI